MEALKCVDARDWWYGCTDMSSRHVYDMSMDVLGMRELFRQVSDENVRWELLVDGEQMLCPSNPVPPLVRTVVGFVTAKTEAKSAGHTNSLGLECSGDC